MKRLKLHVSKENQETINKYNQDCKIVENLRPSSLRNNNVFLRKLTDYLGNKTLKECTVDDLKRFFDIVNYNDKEPLKVAIRKFYKWLYQTDDYPPIVKWIKLKTMKQRLEEREIDSIKKKIVPIEEFQKMVSRPKCSVLWMCLSLTVSLASTFFFSPLSYKKRILYVYINLTGKLMQGKGFEPLERFFD